jgi:uncharacterized membrane protein
VTAEVIVLRLIHILTGIIWVGGMTLMSLFIMPALAGAGPAAAGSMMSALNQKKFPIILPIIALLTIFSGLRLLMIDSANFAGGYFQSAVGRTFAIAGGLAILAFVAGVMLVRPAMMKAVALSQQLAGASDEATRSRIVSDMAAARSRGAMGNTIVLVMLLLAAAGMAVARYMG